MYDLDSEIREIDEYWDRENQYIKDSGIYTPEEVEQILANHEEIRRNKKAEVRAKYKEEMEMLRDDIEQMQYDREMERILGPDDLDADYDLGLASDDGVDYEMLRAMREERDAYDDFIASLDMND